ncbi:MAG: hypothetical protein E7274_14100, partial [Pseudobutyrivibrio ruminis]|uniref:RHS repeat-associated core domain-containing protein n=1 Tax=Pseudobutyrivibrio ruminis TaxID=46206 RepID=UPI0026EFDBE3
GYQHDEMTGSYFAQARYYDAGVGRFVSEDKVRGFIDYPESINHYLYCWNRPLDLKDTDGLLPSLVTSIENDLFAPINEWFKSNTDFTYVDEQSTKGLAGPYVTNTNTVKTGDNKLFNVTYKNGKYESTQINIVPSVKIGSYQGSIGVKVDKNGLNLSVKSVHTDKDGNSSTMKVDLNKLSVKADISNTVGKNTTGCGFRFSLNPFDSDDIYTYDSVKINKNISNKTEMGYSINSGIGDVAIAAIAAIVYFAGPTVVGAIGADGAAGAEIISFPAVASAGTKVAAFFFAFLGLKTVVEANESSEDGTCTE